MGVGHIVKTPIGNLEDMTLQGYYKLNSSDIVACEDKKIAAKLFDSLEKKKLGEKFRNFFEQKMLLNDHNYSTESFFRDRADIFGQGMGQDLSLTGMQISEHPNLFEVRRNKQKMREIQKMEEQVQNIQKSNNLLRDLDSLNFLSSKYDDEEFSGGSYVGGKGADFLNDFSYGEDLHVHSQTNYYDSNFVDQRPN